MVLSFVFFFKAAFCRAVQWGFYAAIPFLPYREPQILPDYNALEKAVFQEKKVNSALIITSPGAEKRGMLAPLEKVLIKNKIRYAKFCQTKPNPTVENVEAALDLANKEKIDCLLALGGGSVIDLAKAVGARMAEPKKDFNQLAGILKVRRKIPTLIAIPTTAGSGSETTPAAVITDEKRHHKYAIMSFPLIPHFAILDPALSATMPPAFTATTGLDALTHAVEAYLSRSTTKKSRKAALEATELIFKNLEVAFENGSDRKAREKMLLASYKAGVAFSISFVGYIHAIAHSIGGQYDTPHGLANAVLMPHLLEGYGKSAHKKLHRLGIAAGAAKKEDSPAIGAKKFIEAIRALNETLKIPATLPEIKKEEIPLLARHAEKEANPLYPVPKLFTAKELEFFYHQIAE